MHIHTCFRIWHPKRRRKQSLPWSHIPSPAPAPFSSWLSNQTPCRKVPGYPALLCFPAIPLAPAALARALQELQATTQRHIRAYLIQPPASVQHHFLFKSASPAGLWGPLLYFLPLISASFLSLCLVLRHCWAQQPWSGLLSCSPVLTWTSSSSVDSNTRLALFTPILFLLVWPLPEDPGFHLHPHTQLVCVGVFPSHHGHGQALSSHHQ